MECICKGACNLEENNTLTADMRFDFHFTIPVFRDETDARQNFLPYADKTRPRQRL